MTCDVEVTRPLSSQGGHEDVPRSEGGHYEQGTWKPLVDPTALLPSVLPFSTEIFFDKLQLEVWKSEIVNT